MAAYENAWKVAMQLLRFCRNLQTGWLYMRWLIDTVADTNFLQERKPKRQCDTNRERRMQQHVAAQTFAPCLEMLQAPC